MMNAKQINDFKVQFISHQTEHFNYIESVQIALKGGCKWIQLRMKQADKQTWNKTAKRVQMLCKEHQATFLLNDEVSLCNEIKSDGVHLGKEDMPVSEARKTLGESYIIGATCNTVEDIIKAQHDGADYVGLGPFTFTTTKEKLSPILGFKGYENILRQLSSLPNKIPIVAIGGIKLNDIKPILQIGLDGIALSGLILQAQYPIDEMKKVLKIVQKEL